MGRDRPNRFKRSRTATHKGGPWVPIYDQRVGDIADEEWLRAQLDGGVPITRIALEAEVSRPTVYAWIDRHQIQRIPHAFDRPSNDELAALYAQCRNVEELSGRLGVARDTARRWLSDAGIERVRARVDADEVRRQRSDGATIAQLAEHYGVSEGTIKRRLDPSWGS